MEKKPWGHCFNIKIFSKYGKLHYKYKQWEDHFIFITGIPTVTEYLRISKYFQVVIFEMKSLKMRKQQTKCYLELGFQGTPTHGDQED